MDQPQKTSSDQITEDTDLSKQYQEILNQYSKELQTSDPQPVAPPVTTTPPLLPPSPTIAPSPTPPPTTSGTLPPPITTPIPAANNIFKYFFYLSLLIFLGVSGTIAYTILKSSNGPTVPSVADNTPVPTIPTTTQKYCETNDKKVQIGESFPAADSCNTCTCSEDLTISCTEIDCSTAPTAAPTDIPVAQ